MDDRRCNIVFKVRDGADAIENPRFKAGDRCMETGEQPSQGTSAENKLSPLTAADQSTTTRSRTTLSHRWVWHSYYVAKVLCSGRRNSFYVLHVQTC